MSFFDTQILIRIRDNIPSPKPLSSPSLTQRARQTPPAVLLMELKHEGQIKCCRRLGDINAVHSSLLRSRFQQFIAKRVGPLYVPELFDRWLKNSVLAGREVILLVPVRHALRPRPAWWHDQVTRCN